MQTVDKYLNITLFFIFRFFHNVFDGGVNIKIDSDIQKLSLVDNEGQVF